MKILRRLIAWSCFVGFLAAVGVAVFLWVRYRPRLVLEGPHEIQHLSADGRWLVTTTIDPDLVARNRGYNALPAQLHVYDIHVGRCIRSVDIMQNVFHGPANCCFEAPIGPDLLRQSRDGQWVAWCAQHDVCLLNWKTGRLDKVRFNEPESERLLEFSPGGRWLVVTDRVDEKEHSVVIDVQTSRVIRRFASPVRTFVKEDRFALVWIDEERLELTDMVSGEVLGSFPSQGDFVASPDGNSLVFGHWPEHPEHDKKVVIWDIRGQPKRLRWPWQLYRSTGLVFSKQSGHIAILSRDSGGLRVTLIEAASDRLVKTMYLTGTPDGEAGDPLTYGTFSPDDATVLLTCRWSGEPRVVMLDTATGRVLWGRRDHRGIGFSGDGATVLCQHDETWRIHAVDAHTGVERAELASDLHEQFDMGSTSNGQLSLICGRRDENRSPSRWPPWLEKLRPRWAKEARSCIVVAETATGRERFRLGIHNNWARLSENGSTVATGPLLAGAQRVDDPRVLVWSVHPQRAYFWAVRWSLGVGAVLLLLRRWRQTRKSRPQPSPPA